MNGNKDWRIKEACRLILLAKMDCRKKGKELIDKAIEVLSGKESNNKSKRA